MQNPASRPDFANFFQNILIAAPITYQTRPCRTKDKITLEQLDERNLRSPGSLRRPYWSSPCRTVWSARTRARRKRQATTRDKRGSWESNHSMKPTLIWRSLAHEVAKCSSNECRMSGSAAISSQPSPISSFMLSPHLARGPGEKKNKIRLPNWILYFFSCGTKDKTNLK